MRIVCLIATILCLILDISGCKRSQEQTEPKTDVRAERKIEKKPEQKVREKVQMSQLAESEDTSIEINPLIDREEQMSLFRLWHKLSRGAVFQSKFLESSLGKTLVMHGSSKKSFRMSNLTLS